MKPITHLWSGVALGALLLLGANTEAVAQGSSALHLVSSDVTSSAWTGSSGFLAAETEFGRDQLRNSRVRRAYLSARPRIDRLFYERNISRPAAEVYLRVFKRDRILEVWVRPVDETRFQLLKTYGICALAGKPGPKVHQGDKQVPEGFYHIDLFNPNSQFHLSMRINYPNARDEVMNRGRRMGGDIYIHGDCRSEGCLAMTDDGIEDLYWLAVEARSIGQREIPVHIFPARLDAAEMEQMVDVFADQPHLIDFWKTLKPGYDYFEQNRRVPRMMVDGTGTYRLGRRDG